MRVALSAAICLSLAAAPVAAGELVYRNGFESAALVSGTASGLVSTGLRLTLVSNSLSETLLLEQNGRFLFHMDVTLGDTWTVSVSSLPNAPQEQSCQLTNATGLMAPPGADSLLVDCDATAWEWDVMSWDSGGWN